MDLKKTQIGIELGSTRIKAVMIDDCFNVIASGSYQWDNRLVDGIWTYTYEEIDIGLQSCFKALKDSVFEKYNLEIEEVGAIGISAMMHGYIPLDKNNKPLTIFRTWRNTNTEESSRILTNAFGFNVPQRWSIAHFYQAILNNEDHLQKVTKISTLATYIHYRLTGKFVAGVGEASGMFPVSFDGTRYDPKMISTFADLTGIDITKIFPTILTAGTVAGRLTESGAKYLDPKGTLKPGIIFAPPEGDAGTGMVSTNSVTPRTGNVSAGTSDFAMIVLEKAIPVHPEIDIVKTPHGRDVAMVHCNNCTSDINGWVKLFLELTELVGVNISTDKLYTLLFNKALDGEYNCGDLVNFNYLSGEGVMHLNDGRPLFIRKPNSRFTLANFMRSNLISAIATLKVGLDILLSEGVVINKIYGHGGFFKTPFVGQKILSAAMGVPVSVMRNAGEGGHMEWLCWLLM